MYGETGWLYEHGCDWKEQTARKSESDHDHGRFPFLVVGYLRTACEVQ